MESMIRETKLGAKDLSVLIRRKKIAPEIRALLGEYTDPRINFAKSAAKDEQADFNLAGSWIRSRKWALAVPVHCRRPSAGGMEEDCRRRSEAYAPLDGYHTYPEIEQAFQGRARQENMADWYAR